MANKDNNTYQATTHEIMVEVTPRFLNDQSDPALPRYVWAYDVAITNKGKRTVQLRERSWTIVDANGQTENVHGPGVVGEQPILNPGDAFRYSSGCPLTTPSGFMSGRYHMQDEAGERFDVDIPAFSLDLPQVRPQRSLN
ncbi:MAG: Co2+/Mg2+ efflux protein ApaG [Pseudomonadota bacterium]